MLAGTASALEEEIASMKVRLPFLVPGVLLLLIGLLWILQGANVLQGAFMSGKAMWLVIGIIVAVVGLVLGYFGLGLGRSAQKA
jgi:uncharacterized integral membrane protein